MDTEQGEEIGARSVRVFETVILHAVDTIYWLDGSTADTTSNMRRIQQPLVVEFTQRPGNLESLAKVGQMAFWQRPTGTVIQGVTTDTQRARPAVTPFPVAGRVRDVAGFYNPRTFSVSLGAGGGQGVALYPTPAGTSWPTAGGIVGTLRRSSDASPVLWGLLELSVEVSATDTIVFRAQADRNGDFALALTRLPALPESVDSYTAQLSLKADLAATQQTPVNIDLLQTRSLGVLDQADSFQESIELEIHPGEVKKVNSFNKSYLAVQAT